MTCRVMILGGTGNFGCCVARMLADDPAITLLLASRSETRARAAAVGLAAANSPEPLCVDIRADPASAIKSARPDVVIHAVGPFQDQDYRVAEAAIAAGAHYLDLADARDFVAGIGRLDSKAKAAGVAVIAGASSVPCLTAAFIDHYRPRFAHLSSVEYGISAAQATNRGLGTASAILSYVGKPFTRMEKGQSYRVFGWQGLTAVRYPELGLRLFGDCDVPDLSLFPERYPGLQRLRFVAGHEIKLLHLGTWLLSWAVRLRLVRSLEPHADALLRASFLFDPVGSNRSGFHIKIEGTGRDGARMLVEGFMVARQGHGPHIPCLPAALLAKRIAAGEIPSAGARPCLDLIDLDQYLTALVPLDITTTAKGSGIDDAWPKGDGMTHSTELRRDTPLFVFDGMCVLCSTGANFIMRHDREGRVQFASAQSDLGRAIYKRMGLPIDSSYLLLDPDGTHAKTDGYFQLARILGGWYRLGLVFRIIPRPIRDWFYDRVAKNRYRWFGKAEYCCLLRPEQRERLVESDEGLSEQLMAG